MFSVILPAAGKSSRFRDPHYKKPFAPLGNQPVWQHSAQFFSQRKDVRQVILVIAEEDQETFRNKFAGNAALLGVEVVLGGAERYESVRKALDRVDDKAEFIAVHDAARPCIAEVWVDRVFAAAQADDAAILAIPVRGSLKRSDEGKKIAASVSREGLWEAQTPQVFRRELLLEAYAQRAGVPATDDAQLVENLGHPVTLVEGSPLNLKITSREDLRLAKHFLNALPGKSLQEGFRG